MSNDKKTLADAQPGGRVRLGDQTFAQGCDELRMRTEGERTAYLEGVAEGRNAALSAQPSPGGQDALATIQRYDDAGAAFREALSDDHYNDTQRRELRRALTTARNEVVFALSAQPSPGGQDAQRIIVRVAGVGQCTLTVNDGAIDIPAETIAGLAARQPVEASEGGFRAAASRQTASAESNATAEALIAAARHPSKQPDSVALGEATEFCIENGDRKPAHGSGTIVDSGALQMALNVLRRAGKDEVADALESTAARQPVEFIAQKVGDYRVTVAEDAITVSHGRDIVFAYSAGDSEPINTRQPVGEPEIWVSPGQLEEHKRRPPGQGSNYLPTRLACEGNFTQPLYAAPPAQAVDLDELDRINQPEVMARIRAKQEAKNALHFDTPLPGGAASSLGADHGPGMFYIQDTRQFVGNCPMWWGPNGSGYVTRLDEAGRYTEQEAIRQNRTRETDVPWPCSEIDALARQTVDCQHMRPRAERLAELALIDSQAVGNG